MFCSPHYKINVTTATMLRLQYRHPMQHPFPIIANHMGVSEWNLMALNLPKQGSFCVCTQPMKDDIRTDASLAECIPKMFLPMYPMTFINPCCAEFILGNIQIYFLFLSSFNMEMAHAILLHERRGPVYPAQSTPWLLMTWCCRSQGNSIHCIDLIMPEYPGGCFNIRM